MTSAARRACHAGPVRSRHRQALLGMVPIVVLLACLSIASGLATLLGLPPGLAALFTLLLAVIGFFISRAILRRGFAQSDPWHQRA